MNQVEDPQHEPPASPVSPMEAKARHAERTAFLYDDVAASCTDLRRRFRFLDIAGDYRLLALTWRTAERASRTVRP